MTDTTTETVEQMALAADEVWCDLMHLMGRASTEGHKVGQCLAEETRVKLRFMGETLRALAQERDARTADAQGHARDARHAESAADAWKQRAEELAEKADKFMWQVRDTCARAEKAEAERDAARAALARWQHYGCPDCGGDCASANPPVACCIMQETRVALAAKEGGQ